MPALATLTGKLWSKVFWTTSLMVGDVCYFFSLSDDLVITLFDVFLSLYPSLHPIQ